MADRPPNILGKFAGVATLFGAALFFTGWIYRWYYFNFFQVELTTLDLPPESFFFVPLQVFFGSFTDLGTTIVQISKVFVGAIVTFIVIKFLLAFVYFSSAIFANICKNWKKHRCQPIDFRHSLWDELIIVVGIVMFLFFIARDRAMADAYRDARSDSNLSVVTLVVPENTLGLGRQLTNDTNSPSGFQIIGDRDRYRELLGKEINDPNSDRTWRLLIDRGGYFYLFKTLPDNAEKDDRPVLIVVEGNREGDRLWILSPQPTSN